MKLDLLQNDAKTWKEFILKRRQHKRKTIKHVNEGRGGGNVDHMKRERRKKSMEWKKANFKKKKKKKMTGNQKKTPKDFDKMHRQNHYKIAKITGKKTKTKMMKKRKK